ncbi:MAG TPA: GNAT family N-acetyltransferase [Thermoanaerobaculia bacterium]|nr:GNAT family N-acetyltransferase [Thermoanaerobaculia bacterium]
MEPSITLRPICEDDMGFLLRVYRSTREEELATVVDWTEEQKEWFVLMQFNAQHAWYQEHYGGATFDVVLVDGVPAGRLYVHRRETEIRLVDIALLPEVRNRGIGSALLAKLLAETEAAGKPLTIHVEKYNPAMQLYRRLGFKTIADRGVYDLLEWTPGSAPSQLKTAS